MTSTNVRRWAWIHKWSSLVCTIFMLLLCITGLPLIFHHQIDHLLGDTIEAPAMPPNTPFVSVDRVIAAGMAQHPGKVMQYISREADEQRIWNLTLADGIDDPHYISLAVDARDARVLGQAKTEGTVMTVIYRLHVDMFAGLPGKLFLGLMGLLLIVAIVSGVVLYAPFMRKLDFGTVRAARSRRVRWLDLHNLLGIVTLVWALVVGGTGMINTWADLLLKVWQFDQLADMLAPYKNLPPPTSLAPLQQGLDAAIRLEPTMDVSFVAWPGTAFSSPHHYGVFMHGREAFNSRLYKPVLVDAQTGKVSDSRGLPWYLTALLLSQPLHFGDYGGLPLQILWTVLDVGTIVVLGSGLYLWLKRARKALPVAAEKEVAPAASGMPAIAREPA